MAKFTETYDMTECTTLLAKKPNTLHGTTGTPVKTMWYINDVDDDMFIPSMMFPIYDGIQEITAHVTRVDSYCEGVDERTAYWTSNSHTWANAGVTFTNTSSKYSIQKDQYFTNTAIINYSSGGEEITPVTLFNFNPSKATWDGREYQDTETYFMINDAGQFIGPENTVNEFDTIWFAPMPFISKTVGVSQSCCPLNTPSTSLDDISEYRRIGVAVLTPDNPYTNIRAPRQYSGKYGILYFANINGSNESWRLIFSQTDEEESGEMEVAVVENYAFEESFDDWMDNLNWRCGTSLDYSFDVEPNECKLFLLRSNGYVGWYDCTFTRG